jgi:hypothetical protein
MYYRSSFPKCQEIILTRRFISFHRSIKDVLCPQHRDRSVGARQLNAIELLIQINSFPVILLPYFILRVGGRLLCAPPWLNVLALGSSMVKSSFKDVLCPQRRDRSVGARQLNAIELLIQINSFPVILLPYFILRVGRRLLCAPPWLNVLALGSSMVKSSFKDVLCPQRRDRSGGARLLNANCEGRVLPKATRVLKELSMRRSVASVFCERHIIHSFLFVQGAIFATQYREFIYERYRIFVPRRSRSYFCDAVSRVYLRAI